MNTCNFEFYLYFSLFLLFFLAAGTRVWLRSTLLFIASFAFYASWNWRYPVILLTTTAIDYSVSFLIARSVSVGNRKLLLTASVLMNLGILAFFKYHNFFLDIGNEVGNIFGICWHRGTLGLVLPVGLSFYTLQRLGYMIELSRGKVDHERSFVNFAAFVSFFPTILSGPILRADCFLSQFRNPGVVSKTQVESGLFRIIKGLVKKIVIADYLATLGIDQIFSNPQLFSSLDLLMAIYGYTFQLYNDFSGYTDIAIGLSMMLGFSVPENFNKPYVSTSIREFWRRWHISLSTWLRDYLYIPLGGSRAGQFRRRCNLMITMTLCGAWHGNSLNFLLWGFYHGFLLGTSFSKTIYRDISRIRRIIRQFVTFHLIAIGWLIFRLDTSRDLLAYVLGLERMSTKTQLDLMFYAVLAVAVAAHMIPETFLAKIQEFFFRRPRRSEPSFIPL